VVKKSNLLEKLKSRLRTTDVRVERPNPEDRVNATTATRPDAPRATVDAVPARVAPEQVAGRKISQKEEAQLAISDGFKELTSLLRGMQHRVEDQGERFAQAADGIARLPALQASQLELLRGIADRLDRQNAQNDVVVRSLGDLPELLGGVRAALERAAATDERTAATLDDFRTNMARIQDSMERMVDHSRQHAESARKLAGDQDQRTDELRSVLADGQERAAQQLERTQREGVAALRDASADQANRLGRLIEDGTRTHRAILIMLGLVFAGLVAVGVLLASG